MMNAKKKIPSETLKDFDIRQLDVGRIYTWNILEGTSKREINLVM